MRIIKKREQRKSFRCDRLVYRVYYGDQIVFVGKTAQPLCERMKNHFFKKKYVQYLDINQVSKIEYTVCRSAADMYLYEIYYINLLHPELNKQSNARDNLTVKLPNKRWLQYRPRLFDKWKQDINDKRA